MSDQRPYLAAVFAASRYRQRPLTTGEMIDCIRESDIKWSFDQADTIIKFDNTAKSDQLSEGDDWMVLLPSDPIPRSVSVVSVGGSLVEFSDNALLADRIFSGDKKYHLSDVKLIVKL